LEHTEHFAPEEEMIRLELALAEHTERVRVQREQVTAAAQAAAQWKSAWRRKSA
jgi:hypothetical protein